MRGGAEEGSKVTVQFHRLSGRGGAGEGARGGAEEGSEVTVQFQGVDGGRNGRDG